MTAASSTHAHTPNLQQGRPTHPWPFCHRHQSAHSPDLPSAATARSATALAREGLACRPTGDPAPPPLCDMVPMRPMAAAAAAAASGSTCRLCRPCALCSVTRSSCTVGVAYRCPAPVCSTGCCQLSQEASAQNLGGTSARPEPTGPRVLLFNKKGAGAVSRWGGKHQVRDK